jgi:hypothetical protein
MRKVILHTPPETIRRLCCAVDARDYSSRTAADQFDLQADLVDLLAAAAQGARLERLAWSRQEGGDGELSLLPPEQSESVLIDDFVRELDAALHRHNRVRLPEARLRLRVAIHFGVVFPAASGYAGPAAVVVSRLLASRPLKQALESAPDTDLVVGLSDGVYQDTVLGRLTKTLPEAFDQHRIDDEKYRGLIWIRTVERPRGGAGMGGTAQDPISSAGTSGTSRTAKEPTVKKRPVEERPARQSMENVFNGDVQAEVIGYKTVGSGS